MANSVQIDPRGPDWPLGNIVVPTPGTPVNIMSIVDPTNANDPATLAPSATGVTKMEYTPKFQQIIFQGFKAGANGLIVNTGNVYIVRKPIGAGSGGHNDLGCIVFCVTPGQTFVLAGSYMSGDMWSPYRYSIDADTANDACQVTGIVGG